MSDDLVMRLRSNPTYDDISDAADLIDSQQDRIAQLETALRFYADKNSWVNSVSLGHPQIDGMTSLVELDKGSKALAALGGGEDE